MPLCLRLIGGRSRRWGSETAYSGPRGEGMPLVGSEVRAHDVCGDANCAPWDWVPWNWVPWNCAVVCGVWNRPVASAAGWVGRTGGAGIIDTGAAVAAAGAAATAAGAAGLVDDVHPWPSQ
jgi:hypothetical protein